MSRKNDGKELLLRLDQIERAAIEKIATDWGMTISAALRRLIREYN